MSDKLTRILGVVPAKELLDERVKRLEIERMLYTVVYRYLRGRLPIDREILDWMREAAHEGRFDDPDIGETIRLIQETEEDWNG